MKKIFSFFIIFFVLGNNLFSEQIIHLSIDDVIWVFEDLTKNETKYNSAFENSILKQLKNYHDKYDAKFSLYCFYASENFNLSMCTAKFKYDFVKNSDWLKFGFHGYNKDSVINQNFTISTFYKELLRIVGTEQCFTNILRLHFFSGNEDIINEIYSFYNNNIILLTADIIETHPTSYYLNNAQMNKINQNEEYKDINNIVFWMTDYRLDDIKKYKKNFKNNEKEDTLVIFTHEKMLHNVFRKNVFAYIRDCINKKIIKKRLKSICKKYSKNYCFVN